MNFSSSCLASRLNVKCSMYMCTCMQNVNLFEFYKLSLLGVEIVLILSSAKLHLPKPKCTVLKVSIISLALSGIKHPSWGEHT